jgi:hypothetical protein
LPVTELEVEADKTGSADSAGIYKKTKHRKIQNLNDPEPEERLPSFITPILPFSGYFYILDVFTDKKTHRYP